MQSTTSRPKITVTTDGHGVASHAGSRLLTDLADVTGLTEALSQRVWQGRRRRSAHDPGRVLVDLAVMLADGGRGISGLAVLRNRPELFGAVASTPTAWRVLNGIDAAALAGIRAARAQARERLWAQRAETVGPIPDTTAGGRSWPGLRLVVDATLVTCHSDKELAAPTFKGGFGYHPLTVWLDNTNRSILGRSLLLARVSGRGRPRLSPRTRRRWCGLMGRDLRRVVGPATGRLLGGATSRPVAQEWAVNRRE